MALCVALTLAIAIVALSGASVASAASATVTVGGTVRDDAGSPVSSRWVTASIPVPGSTPGTQDDASAQAVTDADGHYSMAVRRPTASYAAQAELGVYASDGDVGAVATGFGAALLKAGSSLTVDLVVRRRDATMTGRVSVRDGGSPEGATVTVVPQGSTSYSNDSFTTQADPDGTWSVAVLPGRYRVLAESRYGLQAWAPDLPQERDDSPLTSVAAGGTATVDVSLRHRLAGPALDEYGTTQNGYDRGLSDVPEAQWGRYPIDPHRSVTSTIGPKVKAVISPGDASDLGGVRLTLTNTGDDDAWFGRIRFEGGDRFTCYSLTTDCAGSYVLPGKPAVFTIQRNMWGDQRDFHTTVVVPLTTPSGTLRLPVSIHDPNPTSAQVAQQQRALNAAIAAAFTPKASAATHAPIARPGAGGDVGRVLMTKNRLRVTFPAAGTASSIVDRVVARKVRGTVKRRWRTVRRVTLRAAGATTQVARMKRLAKGRYRVRTTYAIGTRAPRTTTTTWSIRR